MPKVVDALLEALAQTVRSGGVTATFERPTHQESLRPKTYDETGGLTGSPRPAIIRRTMPPWSMTESGSVLHVEIASGVQTGDLERLIDALGEATHGYSSVDEIVFHLPASPLPTVVVAFLQALAETVQVNGVDVRFDPEMP